MKHSDGERRRSAGRLLCGAAGAVLGLLAFAVGLSAQTRQDGPIYKDPDAPVEQRVEDLLVRMTLEEKLAQITTIWGEKNDLLTPSGAFDSEKASRVYPAGIIMAGPDSVNLKAATLTVVP